MASGSISSFTNDKTASCLGLAKVETMSDASSLIRFKNNSAPSHTSRYGSTIKPAEGSSTPADMEPAMATASIASLF